MRKTSPKVLPDLSGTFALWVSGNPIPSGSRRVVPVRRKCGNPTYRLIAPQQCTDWVATVRYAAQQSRGQQHPWTGALDVDLEFRFPRPRLHYRGGVVEVARLRPNAPRYVTRRPDLDKLCRAILDALTGVVWGDDAQVARCTAIKIYSDLPGVSIRVSHLEIDHG